MGIVKPPRYSQGSPVQSTTITAAEVSHQLLSRDHAFRRSNSLPWETTPEELRGARIDDVDGDDDHNIPATVVGNTKDPLENSMHSRGESLLNTSMHSNQSWVPTGVDFSKSMEVFVFEKND
mmetsp:Transcript_28485/g.68563  ORF Transcript_28485/g.68563 Transcript_28485/m.68563 type:complete len:122 (+) Transcript_28485:267-632(+)